MVEISRLGELPDVGAKMSQGMAEARVWRSGVATAAQRTGHGGVEQGSGAGVLGGGRGGVVRTGGSRGQNKKGKAGDPGVRALGEATAITAVICAEGRSRNARVRDPWSWRRNVSRKEGTRALLRGPRPGRAVHG